MLTINKQKCTQCKQCESLCPTLSIDVQKNRILENCINCFHCISICKEQAIEPNELILGKQASSVISPKEYKTLLLNRRTHRNFSDKALSQEQITAFITDLRHSPTASNSRSLEFTVITNKEVIQHINNLSINTIKKAFKSINGISTPVLQLLIGKKAMHALPNSKRNFLNKAEKKQQMITYNAPAIIIVHAPKVKTGMPIHDASIWTGMACLYAETLSYATCINGYLVNAAQRNKELKQMMKIPVNNEVLSALLIGYSNTNFIHNVNRSIPNISYINN